MPCTGTERDTGFEYQPALDGIRALAVLAVMAYHDAYKWAKGGFLGVDAFFVLSGFLITTLLVLEWQRARVHRAGRLLGPPDPPPAARRCSWSSCSWPSTALIAMPSYELDRLRYDGLAGLFYVANWRFIAAGQSYFDLFTSPSPFRHLWSLAIEEQFYLVWPLVVLGCLRLGRGSAAGARRRLRRRDRRRPSGSWTRSSRPTTRPARTTAPTRARTRCSSAACSRCCSWSGSRRRRGRGSPSRCSAWSARSGSSGPGSASATSTPATTVSARSRTRSRSRR